MKKIVSILFFLVLGLTVVTEGAPTIRILTSVGPTRDSDSFNSYLTGAVHQIRINRGLPVRERISPTDATELKSIDLVDLINTRRDSGITFYRGQFNPPAPFNAEHGTTLHSWIDVEAGSGETVSLSDIVATISSSDPDNILGKTETFGTGIAYAPAAIGIRQDGSLVTSGPANEQVKRVIVSVLWKSFPVVNAAGVKQVTDYFAQFNNWGSTITVSARGATVNQTFKVGLPDLVAIVNGDKFMVTLENNGDTRSYRLQIADRLGPTNTIWRNLDQTIRVGQTNTISQVVAGSSQFVRYAPILTALSRRSMLLVPPTVDNLSSAGA